MIAIDWGTTSFRAYRLSAEGDVLETRQAPRGILAVAAGGFAKVLEEQAGDWIAAGGAPVVMSGMVGSRQGWVEVPYVQCPVGFNQIRASLKEVALNGNGKAWIVPGLSCIDAAGVPDVMRGEETQVLGALEDLPGDSGLVCLPGTHSKWVSVREAKIVSFTTHFTGEAFSLLQQHSLLGRMMEPGTKDETAFAEGIERSGEDGGLLHHLFGVRTRGLFGELAAPAAASYLSGILIGHELRSAASGAQAVHFLGEPELVALYARACRYLGRESRILDPLAAARGLFALGRKIGV
jgi:2-dehydro-3-deoxygalactonokinase